MNGKHRLLCPGLTSFSICPIVFFKLGQRIPGRQRHSHLRQYATESERKPLLRSTSNLNRRSPTQIAHIAFHEVVESLGRRREWIDIVVLVVADTEIHV